MFLKSSFNHYLHLFIAGFTILFFFYRPMYVKSAHIEGGEKVIVTSPPGENCYLAGGEIAVRAVIAGDLTAVGGNLFIQDSVYDDLLIGGGDIEISAYVGGDIRILGGTITLSGNVGGDVVITGGELKIMPGVHIGGDLLTTGGHVEINGTIMGQMVILGGEIDFRGKANQYAEFRGGTLLIDGEIMGTSLLQAEEISLGSDAVFHGDVEYWQRNGEIDFGNSLIDSIADYNEELEPDVGKIDWKYMGLGFLGFWIVRLVAISLLVLVAHGLFRKTFEQAGESILRQPMRNLGSGLLYLIGIPIVGLLLIILIVGIPLGTFTLVNYMFTLLFGHVLASLVFAQAVNIRYEKNWGSGMLLLVSILVFLVLKMIGWIPVLGTLVSLAVICLSFGALLEPLVDSWRYRNEGEEVH